jgi:hypothetical protein
MNMSPCRAAAQRGHALAAQAHLPPDWLPSGTFTRLRPPSIVGTSISPPIAAVTIDTGTRQKRLFAVALEEACAASPR